jgi:hypothetical protein
VDACTDGFIRPFPGIRVLKDFRGDASKCTPVSSDVSPGRTPTDSPSYFSNKETVVRGLFIGRYIVDME